MQCSETVHKQGIIGDILLAPSITPNYYHITVKQSRTSHQCVVKGVFQTGTAARSSIWAFQARRAMEDRRTLDFLAGSTPFTVTSFRGQDSVIKR